MDGLVNSGSAMFRTCFTDDQQGVTATGTAALIATHNPDLAARMDRTYRLTEGQLAPLPLAA